MQAIHFCASSRIVSWTITGETNALLEEPTIWLNRSGQMILVTDLKKFSTTIIIMQALTY